MKLVERSARGLSKVYMYHLSRRASDRLYCFGWRRSGTFGEPDLQVTMNNDRDSNIVSKRENEACLEFAEIN